MPQGISKNPLTNISKVYLDEIAEGRAKSLEKASVLDISDDPKDQDEARRIRVMHDYASLKKQQKKKAVAEEKCECDCGQDPCIECGESHHKVDEGFSDWREDLREIVGAIGAGGLQTNPGLDQSPDYSVHGLKQDKIKEKKIKNKIKINPEFKEAVEEIGGQLLEVAEIADEPVVDDNIDNEVEAAKKAQKKKQEDMLKKRIIRMKLRAVNQGTSDGIVASYEPEIEGAVQYFYEQGINEEGLDQVIEEVGLDTFVEFVLDASEFLTEERPARKMNVRTLKATKKKAAEIKADKSDVVKRGTPIDTVRRARAERASKKPKLAKPAEKKVVKSVEKVKETQPAKKPNKQSLRDRVGSAFKKGVERHKAAVSKNEFAKGVVSGVKSVGKVAKDIHSITQVNKKKTVNMQSYEPEGDQLDERLGGKGYKRRKDYAGRTVEGDWEDSDRGAGNKATRRSGGKVEKKSPTYRAYVLNKEEVEVSEDTKRTTTGRWIDKKGRSHKFAVTTHTGDDQHVGSIVKSQYPAKRVVITGQSVEKKKKEPSKKKKKVEEGKLTSIKATTYGMPEKERQALIDAERKRQGVKPRPKKNVEEEVGISSAAAMEKARKEAELRRKEEQAVKKEKKALKKEEVQLEDRSAFKRAVGKVFGKEKREREAQKATDAGARARRVLQRREYADKVSGSTDNVPDNIRDSYEATKQGEVLSAFKRDPKVRKRFEKAARKDKGPGTVRNQAADDMLQTAKNIAKRKGDTSKSDDRYAYEETQIDELNRYGKETGKATGSLNKRPGTPVRRGGSDDRALQSVQRMIRKQTGRPEGQKRRDYDERHSNQNRPESPASTVTKRRERKARAVAAMMDTRGT